MSETRTISVTEALKELKLYDSKIMKAQNSLAAFVGAKKKSDPRVGVLTVEEFNQKAKASWQSINDLIDNRDKLKRAIVQSNAATSVEIGGMKYTVAEAIEKKSSIEYSKRKLDLMKSQYKLMTDKVSFENARVDAQVDKMLETYIGKDSDKKISDVDFKAIEVSYRERNEYELVDPLNLLDKIYELENFIDTFEAEVDVKLSISNSVTYITV